MGSLSGLVEGFEAGAGAMTVVVDAMVTDVALRSVHGVLEASDEASGVEDIVTEFEVGFDNFFGRKIPKFRRQSNGMN